MSKLINPAPIIKKLAERCLVAKGIECSILGEVIDFIKAAPAADAEKVVRCKDCKSHYYNEDQGAYCCEAWGDGWAICDAEESCSRGERRTEC